VPGGRYDYVKTIFDCRRNCSLAPSQVLVRGGQCRPAEGELTYARVAHAHRASISLSQPRRRGKTS